MLEESNNVIAENLARHVAIAAGQPASFAGAAAATESALRKLGVAGLQLFDGSGLSVDDRIPPAVARAASSAPAGPSAEPATAPRLSRVPLSTRLATVK